MMYIASTNSCVVVFILCRSLFLQPQPMHSSLNGHVAPLYQAPPAPVNTPISNGVKAEEVTPNATFVAPVVAPFVAPIVPHIMTSATNAAPASFTPPTAMNGTRKPTMTREQLKYCTAIIKQLKRHRDAPAFLHPVDPVLLKIPDYPLVVKHPMDLTTVERKLTNLEYDAVEDFVQDLNLVFSNCYLYNGREATISICASNLESSLNSSLRHMPKEVEYIAMHGWLCRSNDLVADSIPLTL